MSEYSASLHDAACLPIKSVGTMLATVLTAVSALQQILLCEDDITFVRVVKVVRVELRAVTVMVVHRV